MRDDRNVGATRVPVDVTGRPVALRDVDLDRFFHPRTVVVIGASDTKYRPNTAMWKKICRWGEAAGADVIPINPSRDEIDGRRCYDSILDVPGDIDLAVILVGDALDAFETVVQRKPAFAVIFAAGFAEVGARGEKLQGRLERLIAEHHTHLLGPNTNLNAFETFRHHLPGRRLALITQSGHQGRPIFQAQELGIPLSHWAPTGNEADLEFADFCRYFADQDDVAVVAAYVEGFKDGRTLMLAADHAAKLGKPIVLVKVGRTEAGRSMAKSHTGHLAGSDVVTDGVFRQFGVVRVDELDEVQDVGMMFARSAAPVRRRDGKPWGVCVYAISGGTGAHMADLCSSAGLYLPELTRPTQRILRDCIPGYLRVSNPVDSGGAPSADKRGRVILDAIVADPRVDVVICPITGALPTLSAPLARDLVAVAETTHKPICVIWGSPILTEAAYAETLLGSQVPLFRSFGNCITAVKAYLDHHAFLARYRSPFDKVAVHRSPAWRSLGPLPGSSSLSEHASKELLRAYGIPVSDDVLVHSASEAIRAAKHVGEPVVMKVSSPDLLHKTEHGLVKVGVAGATDLKRAYAELTERAAAAEPDARIDGVLVCEMVTGGTECVVGVTQDDLFGPAVMFGLGGVFVEVLGDVTFRVPPFGRDEALRMIHEVRGLPLLQGARGRPPADLRAIADVLVRVQRLAVDLDAQLAELDINPLVARPDRAVALDALVITR